ncbi:type III secretion system HrpP C-terminal domain-containing protein [Pseudomonas sp. nanlin1]|uniref:type III secretion system HrpP C-terminal domain-containing protein n=1 Tax=Pseudomonas sp. nanlin1 TaxID=3040605 RepID=UPI00388EA702
MNLNSAVEHRPPPAPERREPPARAPAQRPQAQTGAEPERPREAPGREASKLRQGEPERLADGLFFQQLLAPLGNSTGQGQGGSHGQSNLSQADGFGAAGLAGWGQLVDDLAQRLPGGAGQALQATLFMPNLGRIGLNARHRPPQGWDIELNCAQASAAERLTQQHPRCQDDLGRALRQPVNLSVRHGGGL